MCQLHFSAPMVSNGQSAARHEKTCICGVFFQQESRHTREMDSKPKHFTWDDEPDERTTTFESSTQQLSSWQDTAVATRANARRKAAKRGLFKLGALVVGLLGVSGWLLYEISKRV
jgi:hypothetical protein